MSKVFRYVFFKVGYFYAEAVTEKSVYGNKTFILFFPPKNDQKTFILQCRKIIKKKVGVFCLWITVLSPRYTYVGSTLYDGSDRSELNGP